MPSPYLSKSDFKACFDCPTKLYYRKHRYPSGADNDEYLQLLADGGFMVETIAKAKYPEGVDLVDERDPATAVARTRELLAGGDGVLFEAEAISGKYYVRVDILRRVGRELHLIEVKSSSLGDDDDFDEPFITQKGTVASRWKEYLMDVAFQTMVVRAAFPAYRVVPFLAVVDKRRAVSSHETLDKFQLVKDPANERSRPRVRYAGDLSCLAKSRLVLTRDVTKEVDICLPEVTTRAEELAALLTPDGVTRSVPDLGARYKTCRVCDYRIKPGEGKSGFDECWGPMASVTPHLLDLYRVGQIGGAKTPDPVPGLLARGRTSILDLEETDLGAAGSFRDRRVLQWSSLRQGGVEIRPEALKAELLAHRAAPGWPLHFVDFEACDVALPHHEGVKPYERVAFQWSVHTMDENGTVRHAEWLNTGRAFPNFAFAAALRQQLGETGTVYVWSPYEQTTLRRIFEQMTEALAQDEIAAAQLAGMSPRALRDLAGWIDRLLGKEEPDGKRTSARIRDLHDLARRHYFHPSMGGRTSIKVVLPGVWSDNATLWSHPLFSRYYQTDESGRPRDPYKVLPAFPLGEDGEGEDAVREGTGAIRVYQDLLFSADQSPEVRAAREKLLLQYCELDTAAMVMIWLHWTR